MRFKCRINCLLIGMALGFSHTHAGWAGELPFFKADYDAIIKGFSIQATREFRPLENDRAELNFQAKSWIASLNESARFVWKGDRIQPLRFIHSRNIAGNNRQHSLIFDSSKNTIFSSYKNQKTELANHGQALDMLSFQLQLQYDLLNQRDQLIYKVADKNRIKEYRFEVIGEEVIDTPLGSLKATKVEVVRERRDRTIYLWMASDWQYLLARMEQYENGEKNFQLDLTSATVGGEVVTASLATADYRAGHGNR